MQEECNMNITVYLGASSGNDPTLETSVRALGRLIGKSGNIFFKSRKYRQDRCRKLRILRFLFCGNYTDYDLCFQSSDICNIENPWGGTFIEKE